LIFSTSLGDINIYLNKIAATITTDWGNSKVCNSVLLENSIPFDYQSPDLLYVIEAAGILNGTIYAPPTIRAADFDSNSYPDLMFVVNDTIKIMTSETPLDSKTPKYVYINDNNYDCLLNLTNVTHVAYIDLNEKG
jgi:hypothetical protein